MIIMMTMLIGMDDHIQRGLKFDYDFLDDHNENIHHKNHNIAIAISSSLADPVLGLNILQG